MYRPICRRLVALAVAYALALAPVLPLLAFASATGLGEICATRQSGAGSGADLPNEHGAACPLGAGCAMPGCGAGGVLAAGAGTVTVAALHSVPYLIHAPDEALLLREGGAHFARAPPRA
jgi:hypothetical protein